MNINNQIMYIESISKLEKRVKRKDKIVKILNSNIITRFLLAPLINMLELESILLELDIMEIAISGLIDAKSSSKTLKGD